MEELCIVNQQGDPLDRLISKGKSMEKLYFEDYQVGEVLNSPRRTVTEADIVNFAGLTCDWHPVHTDVEYAKQSPFGQRIAHGMLTLCIGSSLLFRLGQYVALPRSFIAFYGMDSVRFVNPCFIGDTIGCIAEVVGMEEKNEARGILVIRNRIVNQRDEDVVVYTTRALAGRRPRAEVDTSGNEVGVG